MSTHSIIESSREGFCVMWTTEARGEFPGVAHYMRLGVERMGRGRYHEVGHTILSILDQASRLFVLETSPANSP